MKGIILAGGEGSRLYPLTLAASKQLLPVYDKPMIYYPLTTLMLAGIREILVITTERDAQAFHRLLGDGAQWGLKLSYATQARSDGIASALSIGRTFLEGEKCMLILGDNIFFGDALSDLLKEAVSKHRGATLFAYPVSDPERYGVVEFDASGNVISLAEKPAIPKSRYAVTGLYIFDEYATDMAETLEPSSRGEYEITDLNSIYLQQKKLQVKIMGRGMAWLDTGTYDSLLEAGCFIETLEKRQGLVVASPEETAYRMGYINDDQLRSLAEPLQKNSYGKYLLHMLDHQLFSGQNIRAPSSQ